MTPRSSATSGRSGKSAAQRLEQRLPGRRAPAPFARRARTRRHRPVGRQAAEVIDAHQVEALQLARRGACARSELDRARPAPSRTADCPTAGRRRRNNPAARRPAAPAGRRRRAETARAATRSRPSRAPRRSADRRTGTRRARRVAAQRAPLPVEMPLFDAPAFELRRASRARSASAPRRSRARKAGGQSHHGPLEALGQGLEQHVVLEPIAAVPPGRPRSRRAGCSDPAARCDRSATAGRQSPSAPSRVSRRRPAAPAAAPARSKSRPAPASRRSRAPPRRARRAPSRRRR